MKIVFKEKNNFSLDTNDFDISFARGLSLEDGAATLTAFSAKIITSKINYLLREYNEKIKVIVCGGGRKNVKFLDQIKLYSNKNFSFLLTQKILASTVILLSLRLLVTWLLGLFCLYLYRFH